MFCTKKFLSSSISAGVAIMTVAFSGNAQAASVGIAQVSLSGSSGQADYVFSNNTTNATFDTISGGAPMNFQYEDANIGGSLDAGVEGNLAAHLFMNSITTVPAASILGGLIDIQEIESGTIQILLDTPVDGKSNLLTVNFTAPTISGFDGGSTPAFSGSDSLAPGETVVFTSDFLNFGGASTGNAFQYTTANADPGLSIDDNGFLSSFVSTGLSTYTHDDAQSQVTAVPEPTAFGALGIGAIGLIARRRRPN